MLGIIFAGSKLKVSSTSYILRVECPDQETHAGVAHVEVRSSASTFEASCGGHLGLPRRTCIHFTPRKRLGVLVSDLEAMMSEVKLINYNGL